MKQIIKLWNDNFNKGVSVFQIFLMGVMILGVIIESQPIIFFSMFNVLFAYLEPNTIRFSFGKQDVVEEGG